ncbi:heat shock factor protein 5 isoform X2 [Ictalurus furcatus]|uniref:heat shock factor protein 5 isoform X2 n=1 Tax=Ictalurus furcatus TaxID=66913 RepID=UPI00235077B7|nr:heat shock factor protein 5 isoform X2 [Ictalurus furcatus]
MEIDKTGSTMKINSNHFPSKLWHLVNHPQICSICWDETGEGILIDQGTFEAEVLFSSKSQMRQYFKTTDFTSFVRQLNLYGFRKMRPDFAVSEKRLDSTSIYAQTHHYHNPNFKRANPEFLVNLKRLTALNKARLADGIEMPRQSFRPFHYPMLNSPDAMKNGSVFDEHQRTPYHHRGNDFQRVKECDRTPKPSQEFVMGIGDPGSVFRHFPMDSPPCAHPSSPMHMHHGSQSAVPTAMLVYQCYSPGFYDSNIPYSQQPAASYAHCRYYPDFSVSYFQCTGQNPNFQAGDAPDPRKSYVNLDTVFNVADEMQASAASSNLPTNEKSPVKTV